MVWLQPILLQVLLALLPPLCTLHYLLMLVVRCMVCVSVNLHNMLVSMCQSVLQGSCSVLTG